MPSDQKDRYIRYLIEQQEEKDLELRAMKLAVEEFQSIHDGVAESLATLQKEMAEIRSELSSERSKRKSAEARARKLDQQLKYAQKNRFGDKRQKARKDEKKEDAADREDEKDKFDGTDGTVSVSSVQERQTEEDTTQEKKERDLSKRPEKYDSMSVEGSPVFHPTDDSKVPGRVIEYKLWSNLKVELAKEETDRSPYLTEALNYLKKFWNGIFVHQKDGNYAIDNNIAERTIRKLTTQRNSMLHFGSDEGVEMAA
ncbi:MAG: transposase, partial [Mediterranea sp.]|nr:transposase [Mediterranea sp.]